MKINTLITLFLSLIMLFTTWTVAALPGDILYSEDFERATIAPWTTTDSTRSNIGTQTSNSGSRSLFTRHNTVTATSPVTNLSGISFAKIEIWIRRGSDAFSEDPDANEDLFIEYLDNSSSWETITAQIGNGGPNGEIISIDQALPSSALHSGFQIRVRQTLGSGSDYDYWHIDDFKITETGYVPPAPPLGIGACDDFELNLNNWVINTSGGGTITTSGATSNSPSKSMSLSANVATATTHAIDTSSNFKEITMWVRRGSDSFSEDPDTNEDFFVEYQNAGGSWIQLKRYLGSGTDGQIHNETFTMPAAAKHANFKLRLRLAAASGPNWDFWHVDDVCLIPNILHPRITMLKTSAVISDGINAVNPKRIPGALVEYEIRAINSGLGKADADSVFITDAIPANTSLYVNDISGAGTGPVRAIDGSPSSGLDYTFTSLASTTDDLSFSNNGGTSFAYTPTPDANGSDSNVTHIRIMPKDEFLAPSGSGNPSFKLKFRVFVD